MSSDPQPDQPAPPLLRVVRGEPTAEELAALVGVVAARLGAAPEPPRDPRLSPWVASGRQPGVRTRAAW